MDFRSRLSTRYVVALLGVAAVVLLLLDVPGRTTALFVTTALVVFELGRHLRSRRHPNHH